MRPIIEIVLHPICNFYCDYCIAECSREAFAVDQTGKKVFTKRPDYIAKDHNGDVIIEHLPKNEPPERILEVVREGKLTSEEAIDFKMLLPYIQEHLPGWDIAISGGEPLLYPNIDKYLEELSKTHRIILLTNGSLAKDHLSLLSNKNIFFRIGYHPEYRKRTEFIDTVALFHAYTKQYLVNYMHHPRHRNGNKDDEYIKLLQNYNFNYEISPFKGEFENYMYDYQLGLFDRKSISPHFTDHVEQNDKWLPGKTFLTMYGNGRIYSCHNMRSVHGDVRKNIFSIRADQKFPHCINDQFHCDSMRAYRNVIKCWDKLNASFSGNENNSKGELK